MNQSIVHIALVVRDYDEALTFYTEKLHFTLVEDTYQPEQDKRWVVIAPPGSVGTTLLLARHPNRNKNLLWEIKRVGGYFYFSTPMISGGTITRWSRGALSLCDLPKKKPMDWWQFLRTCMETCGTYCS